MSETLPPLPNDYTVPLPRNVELVAADMTSGATRVVLRWTIPEDPNVDHYEIWTSRTAYPDENPYMVASVTEPPAAFTVTADQDTVAVLYVRTVMKDGRATAVTESPAVAVNVYRYVASSSDIAEGAIQDQHFDRVSAYRIKIVDADVVSLSANKITSGTLHVGGEATAGPGQIYVYDALDNIIAFLGQHLTYRGIWSNAIWIGGTGPDNAPFYVDSSGNVVIDNTSDDTYLTSFKLKRNNAQTIIENFLEGGDTVGVRVERLSDNLRTDIIPGSVHLYASGAYPQVTIDNHGVTVSQSTDTGAGLGTSGLSVTEGGAYKAGVYSDYIWGQELRIGSSYSSPAAKITSGGILDIAAIRVGGDYAILQATGATTGSGAHILRYFYSSSRPTLNYDSEIALWYDSSSGTPFILVRIGGVHYKMSLAPA